MGGACPRTVGDSPELRYSRAGTTMAKPMDCQTERLSDLPPLVSMHGSLPNLSWPRLQLLVVGRTCHRNRSLGKPMDSQMHQQDGNKGNT